MKKLLSTALLAATFSVVCAQPSPLPREGQGVGPSTTPPTTSPSISTAGLVLLRLRLLRRRGDMEWGRCSCSAASAYAMPWAIASPREGESLSGKSRCRSDCPMADSFNYNSTAKNAKCICYHSSVLPVLGLLQSGKPDTRRVESYRKAARLHILLYHPPLHTELQFRGQGRQPCSLCGA